uniref:Bifunctional inhibitor/plant lipid transfer protein/seed storage helical domain-containing protein n=1 Tax=Kalanchoe fedtschenkoi TaxID=63787 RepID=A0A7N0RJP5_KALFE
MSPTRCALPLTLAAVFLTAFSVAISAQPLPAAPAPGPDCFTLLLNMSDCLTYVEEGSNLTKPEKPCCSELAGLVDKDPICLCQLLGNAGSFGVRIDLSRALKLPDACQVSTPPASSCPAVGAPPSLSPSVSPGRLVLQPLISCQI